MKIMVVEDDEMVRGSIVDILETADYEVLSASNGVGALQQLSDEFPDLIISDIMMPEMDGYSLYKQVREKEHGNEVPFIFLSAKADFKDIRYGMSLGADDYLTKPFKVRDLLQAITIRLDKRTRQKEMLDELAVSIAKYVPHELRTPLVSILGYAECILSDYDSFTKGEILTMISQIKNSGERLLGRIQKFITYADLQSTEYESDQRNKKFTTVNIGQLLDELFHKFSAKYPHVTYRAELEVTEITCVQYLLEYMMGELVENAFKFSPENSNALITVSTQNINDTIKITITNNSSFSIPYKSIESIPAFKQFDRDINQQIGNGVGLSIAGKVCELCGIKSEIISDNDDVAVSLYLGVNK